MPANRTKLFMPFTGFARKTGVLPGLPLRCVASISSCTTLSRGGNTYVERPGYGLEADLSFDQVNVRDYDAILILGGRAPEYLRNDRRLLDIVREFDAQQKWIFVICHGIQVLAAAGLTKGKRITCYEHVRFEAGQAGGTFVDQQAIRDGRIVTGQTWQSHPEFYREIFACLSLHRRS